MAGEGLAVLVGVVVLALLIGALKLLWRAAGKAREAIPDAIDNVAQLAGAAAGKLDRTKQRAADVFREARDNERR